MLDYFAFIVLIVLIAVVIAAWIMLAMMPGQIDGHPRAHCLGLGLYKARGKTDWPATT
jgi:hypothetical protein